MRLMTHNQEEAAMKMHHFLQNIWALDDTDLIEILALLNRVEEDRVLPHEEREDCVFYSMEVGC